MKTDQMIAALAADTLPSLTVRQRLARALPLALGLCLAAFLLIWGPRADLQAALRSGAVLKTLLPVGLALLAGALALTLAHPGARAGNRMAALGLCAVALTGLLLVLVARSGLSGLTGALATPSLIVCLVSIPALALPVLGAVFWALSTGAALRPRLTGAIGGLLAGLVSASVYSLHCDQDAALFVLPAYSAAIMVVVLLGALAGPRFLRW